MMLLDIYTLYFVLHAKSTLRKDRRWNTYRHQEPHTMCYTHAANAAARYLIYIILFAAFLFYAATFRAHEPFAAMHPKAQNLPYSVLTLNLLIMLIIF